MQPHAGHAPSKKSCTYGAAEYTATPVIATAAAGPLEGTTAPFAAEPCAATGNARLLRDLARRRIRSAGAARALPSCAQGGALVGSTRHAMAPRTRLRNLVKSGFTSRSGAPNRRTHAEAEATAVAVRCCLSSDGVRALRSSECARANELQQTAAPQDQRLRREVEAARWRTVPDAANAKLRCAEGTTWLVERGAFARGGTEQHKLHAPQLRQRSAAALAMLACTHVVGA